MSAPSVSSWLLVLGWVALVGAAAAARRPRRVPALPVSGPAGGRSAGGGPHRSADGASWGPLSRLGWWVRRPVARQAGAAPRPSDRLLGAGLVVALGLLVAAPPLAPLPVVAALVAGRIGQRRAEVEAGRAAADALPDAVDLVALAVSSGLALGPALGLVAPHVPAPLGPALAAADARLAHGASLDDALAPLAAATPAARPLVALLAAAHVDGAPVVEALARLSDEARAVRRRTVEARAREVPVRMLFPLVLCTLPAFVLLTIVPPVVAALDDLRT